MEAFDTARLQLRRLAAADEALYCGLYTDAETMHYIGAPLLPERAARSFRKALARAGRPASDPWFLSMIEKSTHNAVGLCGVQPYDVARRQVEIGILLNPEVRRLGYASEGLAALVTVAFSALPIDAVWVQYHPANADAERLFIGLGFLPRVDGEIGGECHTYRVRSVYRSSWGSSTLQN
jgi:RimJ/RimL family protein N-acetyltransferase